MKIELRKSEPYVDIHGDYTEQEWDWLFRADNGAPIGQSMFSYRRRADAIHSALLVVGLSLMDRPKGCKSQRHMGMVQPRGGIAEVYVSYGAGGMVKFAQWLFQVEHKERLVELVER